MLFTNDAAGTADQGYAVVEEGYLRLYKGKDLQMWSVGQDLDVFKVVPLL